MSPRRASTTPRSARRFRLMVTPLTGGADEMGEIGMGEARGDQHAAVLFDAVRSARWSSRCESRS